MKATVTMPDWLAALAAVANIRPGRDKHTILRNLRLHTGVAPGDQTPCLYIEATNLDEALQRYIPADITEEGAALLPRAAVQASKWNVETLTVATTEGQRTATVELTGGNHQLILDSAPVDEYAAIPWLPRDDGHNLEFDAADLRTILRRLALTMDKDGPRPALAGICVDVDGADGKGTLASADGFRLTVQAVESNQVTTWPGQVILPGTAVNLLHKLMPKKGFGTASLQLGEDEVGSPTYIQVSWGTTTLVTPVTKASFPNYKKLIPYDWAGVITFHTAALKEVVRAAAVIAKAGGDSIRIIPDADASSVRLEARAEGEGRYVTTLMAGIEREPSKIAFSARFLKDMLGSCECETIQLSTKSDTSPGAWAMPGNDGYLQVMMPMFVQW